MNYWLVKSEPDTFSIDDMKKAGREPWDGIRNHQARNYMVDEMEVGDLVLFYHSNTRPPGVVGVIRVASEPKVDQLQFEKDSDYYDPRSDPDDPRWRLREMEYVAHFPTKIPLASLREEEALEEMIILRKGNRLSVTPVTEKEFHHICEMGGWKP